MRFSTKVFAKEVNINKVFLSIGFTCLAWKSKTGTGFVSVWYFYTVHVGPNWITGDIFLVFVGSNHLWFDWGSTQLDSFNLQLSLSLVSLPFYISLWCDQDARPVFINFICDYLLLFSKYIKITTSRVFWIFMFIFNHKQIF